MHEPTPRPLDLSSDQIECAYCGRTPYETGDFDNFTATFHGERPDYIYADDACIAEEGTYNPLSRRFACMNCYVAIGMPSRDVNDPRGGWKVDESLKQNPYTTKETDREER